MKKLLASTFLGLFLASIFLTAQTGPTKTSIFQSKVAGGVVGDTLYVSSVDANGLGIMSRLAALSNGDCYVLASGIPAWSANCFNKTLANTLTEVAAPATPASGFGAVWFDSTSHNFEAKNSSGTVLGMVAAHTCAGGQAATAISAAGAVTCGAFGSGSVTSIATTSPITGGTITTTGTIACATCAIGPGSSTTGHLATFANTDGVTLADGGSPTVTSFVQIGVNTLLSDNATLCSFSSISASYNNLRLYITARTDQTTSQDALVRFNNDANNNYSRVFFSSTGGAMSPGQNQSQSSMALAYIGSATINAAAVGTAVIDIPNYAGTTFQKLALSNEANIVAADGSGELLVGQVAGRWKNTAAINRVDVIAPGTAKFKTGSSCSLYGVN